MKSKIIVFMVLLTLLAYILTGYATIDESPTEMESKTAEALGTEPEKHFDLELVTGGNEFDEYRDPDTGVHYIINAYRGIISPKYNADGSLYTDENVKKADNEKGEGKK